MALHESKREATNLIFFNNVFEWKFYSIEYYSLKKKFLRRYNIYENTFTKEIREKLLEEKEALLEVAKNIPVETYDKLIQGTATAEQQLETVESVLNEMKNTKDKGVALFVQMSVFSNLIKEARESFLLEKYTEGSTIKTNLQILVENCVDTKGVKIGYNSTNPDYLADLFSFGNKVFETFF
ncbi:MAG: hypothetical protein ABIQ27_12925 [Flavobacterium sp.]|uniref:hypothetical protein n=1 Tax=Flavobacterium sp. TaxID=239 RepID=UPI0032668F28